MPNKIIVLSDNVTARREAIEYGIGLAKRTEASIVLLLLLSSIMSENGTSSFHEKLHLTEEMISDQVEFIRKSDNNFN